MLFKSHRALSELQQVKKDVPVGTVISALEAKCWAVGNCDIRPRLHDKAAGVDRLVDSGSQITVTKKGPNDKVDNSFRLIAVNGTKIETYGVKEIMVKMGRKSYPMTARTGHFRHGFHHQIQTQFRVGRF